MSRPFLSQLSVAAAAKPCVFYAVYLLANICQWTEACDLRLYKDALTQTVELEDNTVMKCSGIVWMRSCEGECESHARPSIRYAGGFKRECRVCREVSLVEHTVTLARCHDVASGASLSEESTVVNFLEPADCLCQLL